MRVTAVTRELSERITLGEQVRAVVAGLHPDDESGYPREPEYLVLVRALLAQDRPDHAVALLDRLRSSALAQDRAGSLIEIEVLRAVALAAGGDRFAAVSTLATALTLGWRQGSIRVFADEGGPLRALLAHLMTARRTEQVGAANCTEAGARARELGLLP